MFSLFVIEIKIGQIGDFCDKVVTKDSLKNRGMTRRKKQSLNDAFYM